MSDKKRRRYIISGRVQGVGFRPFVYRLAIEYHLVGTVCNVDRGVSIDAQGTIDQLDAFEKDVRQKKPARAEIIVIQVEEAPLTSMERFEITASKNSAEIELSLLPDTALCEECLQELCDPKNRRFRYPFLHCTHCGPRFSLIEKMPFDRANTTMVDFPMCPQCESEYSDPSNRRFHAQTNCCSVCGPHLTILDQNRRPISQDAVSAASALLQEGKIIALKNTGGFLLLVDATNESAIERLRALKQRPSKPFAVLVQDLLHAKKLCHVDQPAVTWLTHSGAPIVLLAKKEGLAPSVAKISPYYGLMLAHTPLQYLILQNVQRPLVATSGNLSNEPLCIDDESAWSALSCIADAFVTHNRRIAHRLDDSLMQIIHNAPVLLRRARGFIPTALEIPESIASSKPIFGAGGHMKNTFAFSSGRYIYISQHLGDLESISSQSAYEQEVQSWQALLHVRPECGAGDLHPDYFTQKYLQQQSFAKRFVPHHRAHVYAALLEHRVSGPFFSIAWDGTGFGEDGAIWGAEAFVMQNNRLTRFASLDPFRLPGSKAAVKEPRRALLGLMYALTGASMAPITAFSQEEFKILITALQRNVNAPLCSSMGRLFDGVSALLLNFQKSQYEGEAALALEALAMQETHAAPCYAFSLRQEKHLIIEWKEVFRQMIEDRNKGVNLATIAHGFHRALADVILALAKRASCEKVLLTGGCMQNKMLSEMAIQQLKAAGFLPLWHREVPPNDGGLSAGQIVATLMEDQHVSCATGQNLIAE